MNIKRSLTIFTTSTLLSLTSVVNAAPGTLDQAPLYVGPAVESNIMLLNDDSGSMDWEAMTRATSGLFFSNQPNGDNTGAGPWKVRDDDNDGDDDCDGWWVLYSVQFDSNIYQSWAWDGGWDHADDSCRVADDEAWRFRNSDFNPLYFDPNRTYLPWGGVDINGDAYTDASITNAPNDPYNPTEWIDLTRHTSGLSGGIGSDRETSDRDDDGHADGFRFYTWNDDDGNGDGLFDNGEETEYQIARVPDGWGKTSAELKQNFANWFTYHRSREYVVKYAISKSLQDVTGVKVGYATLNNVNNVRILVDSMNIDPAVGNKQELFDNLFSTSSEGGTPLRSRLERTGNYFECVETNIFQNPAGTDCPILPASEYGMCQKNFTIMLTDGYYNNWDPTDIANTDTDADGAGDYDGGFYADGIDGTLADIAMHYYERDLNTDLSNEVPTSGLDDAPHQHMTTYTVAFGVTGDLDPEDAQPTDSTFAGWPNNINSDARKIDDLWHTAFNGRGEFFSAQNPDDLINAIQSAVVSASKGSSSAAAVAFNTTSLDTGAMVYQAVFNPADNWKGELIATALNLDGTLADTPTWNAGDQLSNQSYSNRNIITYKKDSVTPGNSGGIPFKVLTDLSATQQADLNMGPSSADGEGQARLDYIRGDRSNESQNLRFRDRTNVLGDVVHSNPVYVGKPQSKYTNIAPFPDSTGALYSEYKSTYENRDGIIYIGSNDGMLHGFDEATGDEIFGYIPNIAFSDNNNEGLHYLTDPAYTHRYYVDLSPTISDVYINSEWRTLIIGGMRAGGRGIFALDITDPSDLLNAENNAADIVQWEFTSDDDPDFGYSMSKPTITPVHDGSSIRWAAIIGNGYNSSGDGRAKLFIIYLDGGQDGEWTLGTDYLKIDTKAGSLVALNGLSSPAVVDTDGNKIADRVYAGDLLGNLWVFDISATNSSSWDSAYKQGQNPEPIFYAKDADGNAQPITTQPIIALQKKVEHTNSNTPNTMVFFGTGQYIVAGDKTSTSSQTVYGIWDNGSNHEILRASLLEQTLGTNSTSVKRIMTDNTINYGTTSSTHRGWFFDLPSDGERIVVNPKIRGDLLFYNTLIPGTQLCLPEGYGWLMVVKQSNGGRVDFAVFDVNNDGVIDSNDLILGESISGIKMNGIPAGSNFLGDVMFTPDDTGQIDIRKFDAGIDGESGRFSWQEITR